MDGLELRLSFGTSTEAQARANTFLREKDLTAASLEQLESRWNVSWSNGWSVGNDYRKRTRYQWYLFYNEYVIVINNDIVVIVAITVQPDSKSQTQLERKSGYGMHPTISLVVVCMPT